MWSQVLKMGFLEMKSPTAASCFMSFWSKVGNHVPRSVVLVAATSRKRTRLVFGLPQPPDLNESDCDLKQTPKVARCAALQVCIP